MTMLRKLNNQKLVTKGVGLGIAGMCVLFLVYFQILFPGTVKAAATYSSSSNYDANQDAEYAFDGNSGTNWQAAEGQFANEWLQIDYGTNTTFNKVVLSEYDNRTSGFRIEYFDTTWRTAYIGTTIGPNKTITFAKVTGTKARIWFTSGSYQPILYEFQIMNTNPRETSIGAIRWDAWQGDYRTEPRNVPYVGLQVERNLGPYTYHDRLPFYAVERHYNNVAVNGLTQAIMDQEIAYAKNAGIDYWAYCNYIEGSGLNNALKLHLTSAYKNDVEFVLISDFNASDITYMQQSNYKTVLDGRPLVYTFVSEDPGLPTSQVKALVDHFRTLSMNAGLENPYIVFLSNGEASLPALGYDAITSYTGHSTITWDSQKNAGLKVIPSVRTGFDKRPRILNGVNWEGQSSMDPGGWYDPVYSNAQIIANVQSMFDWTHTNQSSAEANTSLIYSWNEFDEGGGALAPSLYNGADRLNAVASVTGGMQQATHSSPAALTAPADPNFAAEWQFNGDLYNSIGPDNLAVFNGAEYATGVSGDALKLNGKNYAETIGSQYNGKYNTMTVSAWVKLDTLPMTAYAVVDKSDAGNYQSYRLTIDSDGKAAFVVNTTNNAWYSPGTYVTSSTVLRPGVWYHITGTYDGSYTRMYINGALESTGSQAISGSIYNSVYNYVRLLIGGKSYPGIDMYQGLIDDVRLYSRALTSVDVSSLYSSYSYTPDAPGSPVYFPTPVSRWSFEGNAYDAIGSNHGTVSGTASYEISTKNNGIKLDGIHHNVDIPNAANLSGMSELVVSALIKMDQLPGSGSINTIVDKNDSYRIAVHEDGTVQFIIGTANHSWYSNGTYAYSNVKLAAGAWYHLTGVYDGSRVRIYVNGKLEGIGAQEISGSISTSTGALQFGNSYAGISKYKGMLDEIQIYDASLSVGQVSMLNDSYKGLYAETLMGNSDLNAANNLIASYSFEDVYMPHSFNGATVTSGGVAGHALSLNGINQYYAGMRSFSKYDLRNVTNDSITKLTFGAWVNLDQLPGNGDNYIVMGKDGNFRIVIDSSGKGHATVATDNHAWYGTGTVAQFTTTLVPGHWYYILGTYDGSNVRVYINGKYEGIGSATVTGNVLYYKNNYGGFGYTSGAGTVNLKGKIDEASVYDKALNANEVYELFSSYMDVYSMDKDVVNPQASYGLHNKYSGKYASLEGIFTANGSSIKQWGWGSLDVQRWILQESAGGYYKLKNVLSGKYVSVGDAIAGSGISQWEWDSAEPDRQLWLLVPYADNNYRLQNKYSGMFLTNDSANPNSDSNPIIQNHWTDTDRQLWKFEMYK